MVKIVGEYVIKLFRQAVTGDIFDLRPRMHPQQGVYARFWSGWICSLCDAGRMWLICGGPTRGVQPEYTLEIFCHCIVNELSLSSSVTIQCHCHACMHAWHKWAQPRGSWSNGCVRQVQFSRTISGSTASRQNSEIKAGLTTRWWCRWAAPCGRQWALARRCAN